jgi:hypothetical protein
LALLHTLFVPSITLPVFERNSMNWYARDTLAGQKVGKQATSVSICKSTNSGYELHAVIRLIGVAAALLLPLWPW